LKLKNLQLYQQNLGDVVRLVAVPVTTPLSMLAAAAAVVKISARVFKNTLAFLIVK
jgi:hypothetical protein